MISKAVLLTVLLSAGMAGCQTPQGRWAPPPANAPTLPCQGAICNVDVVVPNGCVINVVDVLDTRRGPNVRQLTEPQSPNWLQILRCALNWGIVIRKERPVQRGTVPPPSSRCISRTRSHQPTRITRTASIS
jgi:hypothetical protein